MEGIRRRGHMGSETGLMGHNAGHGLPKSAYQWRLFGCIEG